MQTKHKNSGRTSPWGILRKFLLLSLMMSTTLVTMTAAAVHTPISRSVQADYRLTEQQKQAAEKSGLSTMLENAPAGKTPQTISVTDNGVTVTAIQTLVDKYRAKLIFRIDGFDLPQGEFPSVEGGVISVAGKEYPYPVEGRIHTGLLIDSVNETATYTDGTPLESDENGTILRPLSSDGSFEYCIDLSFPTEVHSGLGTPNLNYLEHLNSEVVVKITNIGIQNGVSHVPKVAGDWTLKWTLTGTDKSLTVEPHKPIGNTGFTLLNAEVTPLGCVLTMEGDAYSHKSRHTGEAHYWIPQIAGVTLKDGTFVPKPAYGGGGSGEIAHNIHHFNDDLNAMDLDQVQSLAFYNMDSENGKPLINVPLR